MARRRAIAVVLLVGMLGSTLLAAGVSFYSSPEPDGLQRVAIDQGFEDARTTSATSDSPFAGYAVGGDRERFSVGVAGALGVAITAVAAFTFFALLKPRSKQDP
jgi:cobalt/nickel transport system permease protein